MANRRFGRLTVEISNDDKIFFPDEGVAKRDVIDYYERIAPTMVRHVRERPLALERYPDGLGGESFFQKQTPDYFPDWIERAEIPLEQGGTQHHTVCSNAATLVYLANQAVLTPHIWLSRKGRLHRPDRLVFDLDPPENSGTRGFGPVRDAALAVRELLEQLGLRPFVMTTGSRGLHVQSPLRPGTGFDDSRAFARRVAGLLAAREPERLTTQQRKSARGIRLFLDTSRNAYAQTTVAPYALRARRGAPVATPLDWDEIGARDMSSERYTLGNIFRRLRQRDDPWRSMARHARSLDAPRRALDKLAGRT
jgi:bifunctional non-homologous end joining protein LigD